MLIALILAGLLFAALWSFAAFHNEMLKEENAHLLRRAQCAEWEASEAKAGRYQAEQDALSAHAEAVEAQQKVARLSNHVARLLRQSAHDVHVNFQPNTTYHIERATPILVATAQCPEAN